MPRIHVENLTIDIPVLSVHARLLRAVAFDKARSIGGKIVHDGSHITVVRALDQISFTLGKGDRLGLVGPNGAGKSTLIRVLADIYVPSTGKVEREGTLVPMFDIGIGFDQEATGYENLARNPDRLRDRHDPGSGAACHGRNSLSRNGTTGSGHPPGLCNV
jgi:homopolymeric O-antigen transport system ATP-binding protein